MNNANNMKSRSIQEAIKFISSLNSQLAQAIGIVNKIEKYKC